MSTLAIVTCRFCDRGIQAPWTVPYDEWVCYRCKGGYKAEIFLLSATECRSGKRWSWRTAFPLRDIRRIADARFGVFSRARRVTEREARKVWGELYRRQIFYNIKVEKIA